MPRLILGSASPRRTALLRELGVNFTVRVSGAAEVAVNGETAEAFAQRLAREKGAAVAGGDGWVLSADTVVVVDAVVLGKPADADDARRMLRVLSGRNHHVLTAVALTRPNGELADELLVRTAIAFRPIGDAEIDAYIATGEPFDKAGAYGIQGAAGAFVERVDGSYSNVVGLPVDEVRALLERHGFLASAPSRAAR